MTKQKQILFIGLKYGFIKLNHLCNANIMQAGIRSMGPDHLAQAQNMLVI